MVVAYKCTSCSPLICFTRRTCQLCVCADFSVESVRWKHRVRQHRCLSSAADTASSASFTRRLALGRHEGVWLATDHLHIPISNPFLSIYFSSSSFVLPSVYYSHPISILPLLILVFAAILIQLWDIEIAIGFPVGLDGAWPANRFLMHCRPKVFHNI